MESGLVLFLTQVIRAGTPLLFATLGETITERAGNTNLGVEGMMLMGAVIGFKVGLATSNPALAILGAIAAGVLGSLIYAFLTVTLRANQVVSGLSLTIFGTGFAGFVGKEIASKPVPASIKSFFAPVKIPIIGDIPFIGPILFNQDVFIYAGYILIIASGIYLYKTRLGLNLRAVGENPGAADAAGVKVSLNKYVHILMGGALCGLGGAYMSLVYVGAWKENITAGKGWIAVALVIFATWNPYKVIAGSYFFGGLDIIGFRLQKFNISISQNIIDMLPYTATIVVLIIALRKSKENAPPQALGNAYFREER